MQKGPHNYQDTEELVSTGRPDGDEASNVIWYFDRSRAGKIIIKISSTLPSTSVSLFHSFSLTFPYPKKFPY